MFLQSKARVHKTLIRTSTMGYRFYISLPVQRCYNINALSSNACVSISLPTWKYWSIYITRVRELNDLTTLFFQDASNHHEQQALKQTLEKRNRLEELEYQGYQRSIREQKCSICNQQTIQKTCSLNI